MNLRRRILFSTSKKWIRTVVDLESLLEITRPSSRENFDIDAEVTGGQFDVIVDRASIVAIDPSLRDDYVSIMGKLIKPGGSILLITIDRRAGNDEERSDGPPFSIDDTEIERLYGSLDWVESLTKLSEHNEFETEEGKKRWTMQGVDSLFELCCVIKAKKLRSSM